MSNSELFLIKDDEDQVIRLKILGTTSSRFEDHEYHDHHHAMAMDVPELRQRIEQEDREKKGEEEEEDQDCDVSVPVVVCERLSLGELVKVEEDDDGFKTPTSLDNKIPAIKQCPPAPRPNKQLPMKRAKSSIVLKKTPQPLNLLEEVEALFPLRIVSDLHRKIKKARRDDE
ncbi:uncharacterized protein LOC122275413 [Carya illinoinensis]|uniref:Cyclin-dependent protein kinase inhibitor SMR3-like n=1 Tax=Carya illinoinensis TaxID=32201 RepID=A0A8T1PQ80_CARIL|nr:uncharacterized protein LOC122275413 [Carya illinoinensis]KAG6643172.1 hypothetical protein CIPAW_09G192100 [Carya illinoinensis]